MSDSSQLPYLYLATAGWKSGRSHEIEIWFTAWNGRYYVIAERGERAHWMRNLRRNPSVTFRVGDNTFEGQARVVEAAQEPELHRRICALSKAKYSWGDGLVVELAPDRGQ
jgi:deazaflavin-dependent oxidoreductase (nitroreductase family)